jgi:hypothetical protein
VVEPRRVAKEGCRADGRLVPAGGVAKERVSVGGVKAAGRVSASAATPVAMLQSPCSVVKKRPNTPVAVLFAPVVLFKAPSAPVTALASAMLAKSVPAPAARIEAADFIAVDREPTNCCIVCSAREIKKCVLPLCGVAAWITATRWRIDSLRRG